MSWGESWPYTEAPLVSAFKVIEPRHMVQIVERFAENRTNGLQHVWQLRHHYFPSLWTIGRTCSVVWWEVVWWEVVWWRGGAVAWWRGGVVVWWCGDG